MENTLADVIKNARLRKDISQRELSRRTGIDNNTISQIEKGERKKPNSLSLIKLSQELELDLDDLMNLSGYSKEDIDMTYSITPAFETGVKKVRTLFDMLQETETQIFRVESLIESIEDSMKNHTDPAYEKMTEKDINFFDEQSKELIKCNQEVLNIYKRKKEQLLYLLDRTQGFTMRKGGVDVTQINKTKVDDFDLSEKN